MACPISRETVWLAIADIPRCSLFPLEGLSFRCCSSSRIAPLSCLSDVCGLAGCHTFRTTSWLARSRERTFWLVMADLPRCILTAIGLPLLWLTHFSFLPRARESSFWQLPSRTATARTIITRLRWSARRWNALAASAAYFFPRLGFLHRRRKTNVFRGWHDFIFSFINLTFS